MGRALRGVLTGVGCIAVIGAVLVVVLIIVVAVSLGSGEGGGEQEESQPVVARISGTEGIEFSSNIGTIDQGRSVDGTVPAEYGVEDVDTTSLSTDVVSIVMQKEGTEGEMVCEIVVGDEVVQESSTSAEFGTCDVSWSPSQ